MIVWFRRDLRLSDNPALVEAASDGAEVIPLFIVDPRLWDPAGPNRRAFLVGCLRALDEALDGHLVVRHGDPVAVLREFGDVVYAAEDFAPYGHRRDDAVLAAGVD